jgi:hypothetical protein
MTGKIDAQEAVRIAMDAMRAMVDGERAWIVTLGFTRAGHRSAIEAMTDQAGARAYKAIRIEVESGTVTSMKNRLL